MLDSCNLIDLTKFWYGVGFRTVYFVIVYMKIRVAPALCLATILGVSALALSESKVESEVPAEGVGLPDQVNKPRKRIRSKLEQELRRLDKENKDARIREKELRDSGINDFLDLCEDFHQFPDHYFAQNSLLSFGMSLACAKDFSDNGSEIIGSEYEEEYDVCYSDGDCELVLVGTYDVLAEDFLFDNDCPVSGEWCSSVIVNGVSLTCSLQVVCQYDIESGQTSSCEYSGQIEGIDVSNYDWFAREALLHDPNPITFCTHVADEYMHSPVEVCYDDEFASAVGCDKDNPVDDDDAEDDSDQGMDNCIEVGNGEILCEKELQEIDESPCDIPELTEEDYFLLGCDEVEE